MNGSADEQHQRIVLMRRKRFISMALASAGVAAVCAGCKPCLDIEPPTGHSANAANSTTKASQAPDGGREPKPCLDFPPPPTEP